MNLLHRRYCRSPEWGPVRGQGYAVDDGEQELGVRCVAVAVPGDLRSAVSVSGPASRVTHDAVVTILPVLVLAADGLRGRSDRRSPPDGSRT